MFQPSSYHDLQYCQEGFDFLSIRTVTLPLAAFKKETIHFLLFQAVTHSVPPISLSRQEAVSALVPLSAQQGAFKKKK